MVSLQHSRTYIHNRIEKKTLFGTTKYINAILTKMSKEDKFIHYTFIFVVLLVLLLLFVVLSCVTYWLDLLQQQQKSKAKQQLQHRSKNIVHYFLLKWRIYFIYMFKIHLFSVNGILSTEFLSLSNCGNPQGISFN